MEGLASQAKPARIIASIEATIKPPTCAQGHALQAHSLQIILLGPFAHEPNIIHEQGWLNAFRGLRRKLVILLHI